LISDFKYSILLDNKTLVEKFVLSKPAILHSLKTALKNTHIEIEEKLNLENNGDARPYTSADKFKAMAEKNPDIQLLKDQLDLDIEY
jgi:DNA polymerase-3 subunit gamma/tau